MYTPHSELPCVDMGRLCGCAIRISREPTTVGFVPPHGGLFAVAYATGLSNWASLALPSQYWSVEGLRLIMVACSSGVEILYTE